MNINKTANKNSLNGLETGGFGVTKLVGIRWLFLCVSFESFEKKLERDGTRRETRRGAAGGALAV